MDIHILNSLQHNHIKFCYFQQQLSQFCSDLVTYVRLVENWPIIVSDPLFEFELVNTVEGTLWSENEMLNTIIRVFQQEVTTNCAVIMLTLSSAEIRRNYPSNETKGLSKQSTATPSIFIRNIQFQHLFAFTVIMSHNNCLFFPLLLVI